MSNALIDNSTLMDIADAIRAKLETQDTMLPSEMAGNIREISGGGGGTYQQKTVHPLATSQTVNPDSGYDALSSVTVEGMDLQAKTVTPSTSQQTIEPDSNKDGLSAVTVNAATLQEKTVTLSSTAQEITADNGYYGLSKVNVPAATQPTLVTKNITSNGTYSASGDNADGYSSVTVAVPSSGNVGVDLLWTNPSPNSDQNAGTVIPLDLTNYCGCIFVGCKQKQSTCPTIYNSPSENTWYGTGFVRKGATGWIHAGGQGVPTSSTGKIQVIRSVTVSDAGVTINSDGRGTSISWVGAGNGIICKIYGVKGSLPPEE